LRHKLVKLKDEAAKKLAKKNAEKKDVEVAKEKAQKEHAKDKLAIAEASKPITPFVKPEGAPVKPVEPVLVKPTLRPMKVVVEKEVDEEEKKEEKKVRVKKVVKKEKKEPEAEGWSWWPFSSATTEAPTEAPEPETEEPETTTVAPEPVDPTVAAKEDVKIAKACIARNERDLAAAKAELKTLTDDLEKAKKAHEAAIAKKEKTAKTATEADAREELVHEKFDAEHKEYLAAAEIYEKQLRKVDAMKLKLKIASQKVGAMRDAEDKNGGVYPTHQQLPKSESAAKSQLVGFAFIAAAAFVQMS